MSVTNIHKDLQAVLPRWQLTRDACAGADALRAKGETYLPLAFEDSQEGRKRLADYILRAHYYNATGRTQKGLMGSLILKQPTVDLPGAMDFLRDNANGAGLNIIQQALRTGADVLQTGRSGLLVDYPSVEERLTIEQKRVQGIYARIIRYKPEDIINWKVSAKGSEVKLSLVVLKETHEKANGDFDIEELAQYRVLRLNDDGFYEYELHRETKAKSEKFEMLGPYLVNGSDGKPVDEITFLFVGAENNDHLVDPSPLYDLAETNIAHFRNSADFEEAAHLAKELTLVMSGLTAEWWEDVLKKKVTVGSMAALPLNKGADAHLLQANETTMSMKGMEMKEKQMIALGARIVEQGTVAKTATQSSNEASTEHSVLSLISQNISDAYTKCIWWAALFEGVSGEIKFELNREFFSQNLDAQTINALIAAWQSGVFAKYDVRQLMRKSNLIDNGRQDEDIDDEVEAETLNV